jgi:hypothetical protein
MGFRVLHLLPLQEGLFLLWDQMAILSTYSWYHLVHLSTGTLISIPEKVWSRI